MVHCLQQQYYRTIEKLGIKYVFFLSKGQITEIVIFL